MERNAVRYLILGGGAVAVVVVLLLAFSSRPTRAPTISSEEQAPNQAATSEPMNSPTVTVAPTATRVVETTAVPEAMDSPLATPKIVAVESPLEHPRVSRVPLYSIRVVNEFPHDPLAYTQGLVFADGSLYEGTGQRGRSSLRRVDLETGEVLQSHELPDTLFGEGIVVFGDKIYQLTWQSNKGFVYDRDTFDLIEEFSYPTEGWGITHDGTNLIMSDGSSTLYLRDPETFAEVGRIEVHDGGNPVTMLNELEYVDGTIYANVWLTDRIAQISPETGKVIGWIDQAGLLCPKDPSQPNMVLNGIAYDVETGRMFVTCKLWPKLYEVELVGQ